MENLFKSLLVAAPFYFTKNSIMDKSTLWKTVLETLKINLSAANFSTWFPQTFIQDLRNLNENRQIVEIACPSSFIRDTIENRYFGQIKEVLDQICQKKSDLVFSVKQVPLKSQLPPTTPLFKQPFQEEKRNNQSLNPKFTFETFVVGSSNNLAHAASQGIVNNPGKAYNPFFIYGGVGVGKTHLMQAIGHSLVDRFPKLKILYVSAETFTNDLIASHKIKRSRNLRKNIGKLILF